MLCTALLSADRLECAASIGLTSDHQERLGEQRIRPRQHKPIDCTIAISCVGGHPAHCTPSSDQTIFGQFRGPASTSSNASRLDRGLSPWRRAVHGCGRHCWSAGGNGSIHGELLMVNMQDCAGSCFRSVAVVAEERYYMARATEQLLSHVLAAPRHAAACCRASAACRHCKAGGNGGRQRSAGDTVLSESR